MGSSSLCAQGLGQHFVCVPGLASLHMTPADSSPASQKRTVFGGAAFKEACQLSEAVRAGSHPTGLGNLDTHRHQGGMLTGKTM